MVIFLMRGGGEIRRRASPGRRAPARRGAVRPGRRDRGAGRVADRRAPQLAPTAIRALVDQRRGPGRARRRSSRTRSSSVESNYDPRAVSPKGAMGLMQIMPVIARQYGVDDPFDPEENLEAGHAASAGAAQRGSTRRGRWPRTTPGIGAVRATAACRPIARPRPTCSAIMARFAQCDASRCSARSKRGCPRIG